MKFEFTDGSKHWVTDEPYAYFQFSITVWCFKWSMDTKKSSDAIVRLLEIFHSNILKFVLQQNEPVSKKFVCPFSGVEEYTESMARGIRNAT